jgi:DNA mismatch endonuclease (patch repair protein)
VTDVLTGKQRSYNMSRIRGRDTKHELILRKALWSAGLRYRLKSKLPGQPDLFFSGGKVAVFVDGCFWHRCPEHFQWPKTRSEFWKNKIGRNVERDREINGQLRKMDWTVVRIWEHEIRDDLKNVVKRIGQALSDESRVASR